MTLNGDPENWIVIKWSVELDKTISETSKMVIRLTGHSVIELCSLHEHFRNNTTLTGDISCVVGGPKGTFMRLDN